MRELKTKDLTKIIESLLISSVEEIPSDVLDRLEEGKKLEKSPLGKEILIKIIENDFYAKENHLPICQDTGIVVCFLEIGYDVHFDGDIYQAISLGVKNAYVNGYLRKSVVNDPIERINTKDNTPAIIHIKLVPGTNVKITVAPKGGGSENMSLVKMLIPSDGIEGIKKLVLDTVFTAAGKPCPPIIIGIGIGGNFEKCAILAKEALLRNLNDENPNPTLAKLEKEIKDEVNMLGIGPMGFGGTTTCLAVKIETYPCHIASLPVGINIQCHVARHETYIW